MEPQQEAERPPEPPVAERFIDSEQALREAIYPLTPEQEYLLSLYL